MASVNKDVERRFWGKVSKKSNSECWNWMCAKKPKGYGNVRVNKKYLLAHRLSWEIHFGGIPDGMQILHSCDNTSCCNPHHLMLGTAMSNYVDMLKKCRSNSSHKNRKYGEEHHNHKLTFKQVEEIRKRYIPGIVKQKELGNEYGVSQVLISVIVRNEGRING